MHWLIVSVDEVMQFGTLNTQECNAYAAYILRESKSLQDHRHCKAWKRLMEHEECKCKEWNGMNSIHRSPKAKKQKRIKCNC